MTGTHILILGGTAEARQLATELAVPGGARVTTSLAGRVARPRLPAGEVRIGGFGGAEGLAAWLRAERVDAVVDATHPFADVISTHAARAAALTGIPLVALRRPGWHSGPGDRWHDALSLETPRRSCRPWGSGSSSPPGGSASPPSPASPNCTSSYGPWSSPNRPCRRTPRRSWPAARSPSTVSWT